MKEMYNEKKIFEKTDVWAEGFDGWYHLSKVAQFRWTICCNETVHDKQGAVSSLYTLTQLTTLVLDTLIHMCNFFPSRDEGGAIIRPMPRIKKFLSGPVLLYQLVKDF